MFREKIVPTLIKPVRITLDLVRDILTLFLDITFGIESGFPFCCVFCYSKENFLVRIGRRKPFHKTSIWELNKTISRKWSDDREQRIFCPNCIERRLTEQKTGVFDINKLSPWERMLNNGQK